MRKFVTVINCMDGRVQKPVIGYLSAKFSADFVDMITEPGPNKILAENKDHTIIQSIKRRIKISVDNHKSKHIAIVGHYDCAGNPVDEKIHIQQIREAIKVIQSWDLDVNVIGLWINQDWQVEEVRPSHSGKLFSKN
ncbi:hypothetical protein BHF71_05965 [Vulcanibacillus modesticaldus]|uniref:Carbonic anhydrase n=1 Tax=Vulcanibacillus modesticaldus TaxID=337097 RepID=A0A1D2YX03_9BACI|nr:carbonic anhydrase [Vulcanibacillus modesticaldus]OEG00147.1 hypothetical protein BHF71_05965 [Vulcanibacillus modesticaldus]